MRKIYLGLIIGLLTSAVFGQQIAFDQVLPLPPAPQNIAVIEGVIFGSITFADIDNDNDQDLLITGSNRDYQHIFKLYCNDGNGNYYEVIGTPFTGGNKSSVAFSDVDNDNDQDVLFIGESTKGGHITVLYINDGNGNYTEAIDTQFIGVSQGFIAFADIDNDNDEDLLLTGISGSNYVSNLYKNDGNGIFTLVSDTPFDAVGLSDAAFADIDNDGDLDVLITGYIKGSNYIAKLYCNDGMGNYFYKPNPFIGGHNSAIAFSDYDNDNDQDVLITGDSTRQYTNDGNGNFTRVIGAFGDESSTSLAIADIDNDNDVDVLLYGVSSHLDISKLYTNDGSGNFTFDTVSYFDSAGFGSLDFVDIDNDNDYDVLISGSSGVISSKLYINNGTGSFSKVLGSPFAQCFTNPYAFADIDNDNDQDVLFAGSGLLYTNDGTGSYTKIIETPFEAVNRGSIAFADIDNDNDQDVLIIGSRSYQGIAELYSNDGNGNFTEINQPLFKCYSGTVNFADIDNDNDLDLLITGGISDENWDYPETRLYINNGVGVFTSIASSFVSVMRSAVAFADIDNDNDQDVIISGTTKYSGNTTKLYTNHGNGSFTEVLGTPFYGVTRGTIYFVDIDNDDDQDLFINGNIFLNNGSGDFVESNELSFEWLSGYSCKFVDIDNDNDQDIFITGLSGTSTSTKLYSNDGSGNFTEVSGIFIDGVKHGIIRTVDVDNDNDQDVLISGLGIAGYSSKLYRNISILPDGTFEDDNMDVVSLFPNPANGLIDIALGDLKDVSIKVINIRGKLIYHKENINTSSYQLELVGAPGIYIVEVASEGAKQVTKVIKR